jgi:hypothetical protein
MAQGSASEAVNSRGIRNPGDAADCLEDCIGIETPFNGTYYDSQTFAQDVPKKLNRLKAKEIQEIT